MTPLAIKSDKVQLQEFFTYDCATCFKQNSTLKQVAQRWGDKVQHVQIPMNGTGSSNDTQKIFYALEKINQLEPANTELLRVGAMSNGTQLSVKKINTVLQGKDVNLQRFNGMYSSSDVIKKQMAASALVRQFAINQESAVVVNGRYLVKGSAEKLAITLNYLIEKELDRISKKSK